MIVEYARGPMKRLGTPASASFLASVDHALDLLLRQATLVIGNRFDLPVVMSKGETFKISLGKGSGRV
jgi:hypothetical protein